MSLQKEVKVFGSVLEIGKDAIDSLSDDPFFTFGWLRTLESQQSFDIAPIYIAIYEGDKLEALAPCFVDQQNQYFIDGPKIMPFMKGLLKLGQKSGYCQSHVLLCYSPFCLRSKILLKKDPQGKLILDLISKKMDDVCRKERILFSSFLFVSEFDELLTNNLKHLGYSRFDGTTTFYLDVQWATFEDYLKSLKSMNRHSIRREMRKCAENGVTIKEINLKDISENLSELVSNLLLKYNKNSTNLFDSGFFSKLNQYARDKTKLFIAEKSNNIVGFSLCLHQKEALDVFICGFNYEVQTNTDFTYFNLCYYAPIKWGIDQGVKKIYYRRKSERAKLYRGCKLERTYSFVKCHDIVLNFCVNNIFKKSVFSKRLRYFSPYAIANERLPTLPHKFQ